jgi:pimeloyl-ACP methyl ester carboxylesterase
MRQNAADTVGSADGTRIAFERAGSGPAVIMVDPAGGYGDLDNIRGLGAVLAEHFTVYTYDRRGRGRSGDTLPYAVAREVEDLAALVAVAGGRANVYAFSSGGLLALQAAAAGVDIERLALLEPPIDTEDNPSDAAFTVEIADLVAHGHRAAAVEHFLTGIEVPDEMLAGMRGTPSWAGLEAVAHTLVYDCTISAETTAEILARVTTPVLVLDSEGSSDQITGSAAAAAAALPDATHRSLPGGWHGVPDDDLATVLTEYFTTGRVDTERP